MTNNQSHRALVEKICDAFEQHAYHQMPYDEVYPTMARAAIRVVYEALREPSDEMLNIPLGYSGGPEVSLPNGTVISRAKYESRRDLRPVIWQAMLSASALAASPIVQEGETAPVNNGDAID